MLDVKSGEGGILQVCMEGVGLLFATSKVSRSNEYNHFRSGNTEILIIRDIHDFYSRSLSVETSPYIY